jgi:asparagine synthase (glutamine-hydrolysing)
MAVGWLTPKAARRISEQVAQLAEEPQSWEDPEVARDMRLRWRTSLKLDLHRQLAHHVGVTAHAPWTDYDVLRWSHALPSWDREPGREFKALAREGLRGVVPAVVTGRRRKDRLGINLATQAGRRTGAGAIREIVASSPLIADGVFDPRAVSASVERWIIGSKTADEPVLMLLAGTLWLNHRRTFGWRDAR